MRAYPVVVLVPALIGIRASSRVRQSCSFRHSSRNFPLRGSMYALPVVFPGRMKLSVIPPQSRPAQEGRARELRAVVAHQPGGQRTLPHQVIQRPDHADTRRRASHHEPWTRAHTVIDRGEVADPACVRKSIMDDIKGPPVIRPERGRPPEPELRNPV